MLSSVRIRRYRIFRDLKVSRLGRINLFVGDNNVGKTALLEALFLLSGGGRGRLAINRNVVRNLGDTRISPGQYGEVLWKPLFFGMDMNQTVEIEGHHATLKCMTLTIEAARDDPSDDLLTNSMDPTVTDYPDIRSLTLRYFDQKHSNQPVVSRARIQSDRIDFDQPETTVSFPATIVLAANKNSQEDAQRLAKLRTQKQDDILLEALRIIEPKLLSVTDSVASGFPAIWCDIGLAELVPLFTMGEGMVTVARLVLAIKAGAGGMILVDEIENGLHHRALAPIWQVVSETARQNDVQVFATTHSYECIRAAHQSLDADSGFRLHRLEVSQGENRCITYEAGAMDAAIEHEMEVR